MKQKELLEGLEIALAMSKENPKAYAACKEALGILQKDIIDRQELLFTLGHFPINWKNTEKEIQAVQDYQTFWEMLLDAASLTKDNWKVYREEKPQEGALVEIYYFGIESSELLKGTYTRKFGSFQNAVGVIEEDDYGFVPEEEIIKWRYIV